MTKFTSSSWLTLPVCSLTGALAILVAFSPANAQAQDIGSLFTSPEEREYLDYLRQDFVTRSQLATFNINEDVIPDIPEAEVVVEVEAEVINYNFGGVMTRRNGNKMVWLNGQQVTERELPANITIVTVANDTLLSIRSENNSFLLKPGQRLNLQTGNITDSYQASNTSANTSNSPSGSNANTLVTETVTALAVEPLAAPSESSIDIDQYDLGAVLGRLNPAAEELNDEQRQQALDILTEQVRATE